MALLPGAQALQWACSSTKIPQGNHKKTLMYINEPEMPGNPEVDKELEPVPLQQMGNPF